MNYSPFDLANLMHLSDERGGGEEQADIHASSGVLNDAMARNSCCSLGCEVFKRFEAMCVKRSGAWNIGFGGLGSGTRQQIWHFACSWLPLFAFKNLRLSG